MSTEWPNCLGSTNLYRAFRVITAFWQVVQAGAGESGADIVLIDVGPSLGAINRSALIATDYVVVPLAADLFSRQGLRNLGPTLRRWRVDANTVVLFGPVHVAAQALPGELGRDALELLVHAVEQMEQPFARQDLSGQLRRPAQRRR